MNGRRRPMRRLSEVLPRVASELGLEAELRRGQALASWTRIVAEHVPAAAGATWLVDSRPPALIVAAEDPTTGQELRLHGQTLLEAFATAPGGRRLSELRVVVRRRPGPEPPGRATRPSGGARGPDV